MHEVVVSAVAAAVMAATITFNSTSQNREFFIFLNTTFDSFFNDNLDNLNNATPHSACRELLLRLKN